MDDLIDVLCARGVLTSPRIIEAFRTIDRANFVPPHYRALAYEDRPLPLGYEQTISQPSTVAFMLELLGPEPGDRILDVGSGSGWTTALLAHLVGETGTVLGLERVEELVTLGKENLAQYHRAWATIARAGTELGAPKKAPFDKILVSAAARTLPQELVAQLKEHGTMVIPIKHSITRVVRVDQLPIIDTFDGFVFVPLITEL